MCAGTGPGAARGISRATAGGVSLQFLVLMVPVFFGFMGFAIDLGRLYLIKGELNQAASAMALAAAQQLNGSSVAIANATTAAQQSVADTFTNANKYNFGLLFIGDTVGNLTSTINSPTYYAAADDVVGTGTGGEAGADTAKFVKITLQADAPLLFWSLLSVATSRKTAIGAVATAGVSAPLCTGCGIVPIAVPAVDSSDTTNFGFDSTFSTVYTMYYYCTGTTPTTLTGTSSAVPYALFNRYDTSSSASEADQLFLYSAMGLPSTTDSNPNTCTADSTTPFACVNIGDCETVWSSASTSSCSVTAANSSVEAAMCGLYSRLDYPTNVSACSTVVADLSVMSANVTIDTDLIASETPPYYSYTGNGRRIITVAIVDTASGDMTVLGFRQFLIEPNPDGTYFDPTDKNGRFPALYIGYPAPLTQGWFDTRHAASCSVGSILGPGKVVLHQ